MTPSNSTSAQFLLLLWGLGAVCAVLTLHVSLGWVREAQRRPVLREGWRALLLAAAVLGTGLCATAVLSLTAEALAFSIGFRTLLAPLLWLGAVLASAAVVVMVARSESWWAVAGCGVALALLAAAVQFGWIIAVGFRPGVFWRPDFVAVALLAMVVGCAGGLWAAGSRFNRGSRRRPLWRMAGAALIGLGLLTGQEVLMAGAGLVAQVGSVYQHELPAVLLSLLCGALVPLVLLVMWIDLRIRRPPRKRRDDDPAVKFAPVKRRKRRYRIPNL